MDSKQRSVQILKVASELIAYYGFDKTRMEDIAKKAGVSKGALYLIWSSKDELFESLLAYEMRCLLDELQERIENDPEAGRISKLYRHSILALRNNPLMAALYARDARVLGDYVRNQKLERYTQRIMIGLDAIRQMQAAGLLRADIRPEIMTYLFSMIALGFMSIGTIYPENAAPDLEEVGDALAAMMQAGLESAGGNAAEGKETFLQVIQYMKTQYEKPSAE